MGKLLLLKDEATYFEISSVSNLNFPVDPRAERL